MWAFFWFLLPYLTDPYAVIYCLKSKLCICHVAVLVVTKKTLSTFKHTNVCCILYLYNIQGYSKWLSGFYQLVIHNTLGIAAYVFFYLIEQHSKFLLHTLQVLYMCTLCDSTNINTIISSEMCMTSCWNPNNHFE